MKRARILKEEVEAKLAVLQPDLVTAAAPRDISTDPENQLIKTLRENEQMAWGEIAAQLNSERAQREEAPTFTAQTVYSRYATMAPRTATAVHEIGFDTRDYMHLRNPTQFSSTRKGSKTSVVSKAGKKRVKDYHNATELKANMRQLADGGKDGLESPERMEQLVKAVAKIERNFWTLVADEMERSTARLYEPEALKERYHAI